MDEQVMSPLVARLERQRAWSQKTFGPRQTTTGVLNHVRKELAEIEADPSDPVEWYGWRDPAVRRRHARTTRRRWSRPGWPSSTRTNSATGRTGARKTLTRPSSTSGARPMDEQVKMLVEALAKADALITVMRGQMNRAAERGGALVLVPANDTSRTCAACGAADKASRSGARFQCVACGHSDDADLNAAINILRRGRAPVLPVDGSVLDAPGEAGTCGRAA